MARTLHQILDTLDNLAASYRALGHPQQSRVMGEALVELRGHLLSNEQGKRKR